MLTFIKKYNISDALLLLIIITLPLHAHWNSKVIGLIFFFILYGLYKDFKIDFPKIGWFYLVFVVFSSISYFWSQGKPETLKTIIRLYPFLVLVLAYKQFFSFKSLERVLRLAAVVFLFYGFVWLVFAYTRFTSTQDLGAFFHHELTILFDASAVYIALIFGQLYLFLLYGILFSNNRAKAIDILLTTLLFLFQFLLSSKMILTVLILVTVIFFIKYLQKSKFSRKILTFGIVLSMSTVILLGISSFTKNRFKDILDYQQIENVFEKDYFGKGYYWNGLTLRLFQLRCFYEIESDPSFNSFIGTGYNAGQTVLNQKYTYYDLYPGISGEEDKGYFNYNFHNQYIQLVIELGIFGILLIVLMFYFFVFKPLKDKNLLLFGVAILFLSFAITESFLFRQKGLVSFVLFPLLAIYYFEKKEQLVNTEN